MNEYRILGEPMKFETIAIHGGYSPETTTNAVAVPIYQTASYSFRYTAWADLFDLKEAGNIYTRIEPNFRCFRKRSAMEGGIGALALASGSLQQHMQ